MPEEALPATGRRRRVGIVYLLHFSRPYYHARHYMGFTLNLHRRLVTHRRGAGSPLVAAVIDVGIELFLARTWSHATRALEKRGKRYGATARFCPICRGPRAYDVLKPHRDPVTGVGS